MAPQRWGAASVSRRRSVPDRCREIRFTPTISFCYGLIASKLTRELMTHCNKSSAVAESCGSHNSPGIAK